MGTLSEGGDSALVLAIEHGCAPKMVRMLIEFGCPLSAGATLGEPLALAARYGQAECGVGGRAGRGPRGACPPARPTDGPPVRQADRPDRLPTVARPTVGVPTATTRPPSTPTAWPTSKTWAVRMYHKLWLSLNRGK